MKSFVIQIDERDELVLMEVLRRFAVSIQPAKKNTSKKEKTKPKTVAHFLELSQSLHAWSDEEVSAIMDIHNQLNQHQPTSW